MLEAFYSWTGEETLYEQRAQFANLIRAELRKHDLANMTYSEVRALEHSLAPLVSAYQRMGKFLE